MFDLMHTPVILGWVKWKDIEIVQISIICLICFGYDLSYTQDGLTCWRMGFICYGKHPLLLTRIQVGDQEPMGSLVFVSLFTHLCGQITVLSSSECTVGKQINCFRKAVHRIPIIGTCK